MIICKGNWFIIRNGSTSDSIKDLQMIFENGTVKKEDVYQAHIEYDTRRLPDYDTPDYYPLKMSGDKVMIWVSCVSSGYRGEGPNGMIEALKIAGFNVTERTEELIQSIKKTDHYLFKKR